MRPIKIGACNLEIRDASKAESFIFCKMNVDFKELAIVLPQDIPGAGSALFDAILNKWICSSGVYFGGQHIEQGIRGG